MSGSVPVGQEEVFELLSAAASYGEAGPVERIDTHISSVFLVGQRAYKLKRAIRLPFLDFSTYPQRLAACEAELATNRRAAASLYLGVEKVVRGADGRLRLGGEGEAVDAVVVMRRFEQDSLFDRMAASGKLDRALMTDTADVIAELHRQADPRPDQGGEACLRWTIETNERSFAPNVGTVFDAGRVAELTRRSWAALEAIAPLLERRRAEGLARHAHGDLHLGNICLVDGRPTPFDAIEFSDTIACIDVFYDLAFLLMDLDRVGRRDLASIVFNRYVERTADSGALPALPLFLACRAAIRAHVSGTMAVAQSGQARERREAEARDYLDRALAYLDPVPPRLIAVGGFSGSGKSRLGRDLAPYLGRSPGALVVRSDVLRKQLAGAALEQKLDGDGYSPEMTERTYQTLYAQAEQALRDGQAVVADGVFAKPEQRDAIEAVAKRLGLPFAGFWLEAPPEVMIARIESRKKNVSDATADVLRQQLTYDLGPMTWRRLDSSGAKEETKAQACAILGLTP